MRILFVCLGNLIRSQMAEGFYNFLTSSKRASSAGVLSYVHLEHDRPIPETVEVMQEEGIDISKAKVNNLTLDMLEKYDKIYAMLSEDEVPYYLKESGKLILWPEIKDCFGMNIRKFRKTRDKIKARVESII